MTPTWAHPVVTRMLRAGDHPAVRWAGGQRTHRQVARRAAGLAHQLAARGVGPGSRVALVVQDSAAGIEGYLAAGLCGATALHVNDRWAAPEVAAVLDASRADVVLHTAGRADLVDAALGARPGLPVVDLDAGDAAADTLPGPLVDPAAAALVGSTSGTTGTPKGVVHTQEGVHRILAHMPAHDGLRPYGSCAFTGTLAFAAGIWGVVLPHLALGSVVSFMAGLPADAWVDRMAAEGSTFTYAPSPLVPDLVEALRARPEVLGTLGTVLHSASVLPREHAAALVDVIGGRFVETYGMTETGAPVTATVPGDWLPGCAAEDVLSSAGRPATIASVRAVGPDGGPLPAGGTGELEVASETMTAGYLDRPDLTAEVLRDGWLRTGDVGRVDAAGYVYITDRAKDMVVSGGMNVYPAEVERVLAQHPGIAEVSVLGLPDARWGEAVTAVVVPRPGAGLDPAGVREFGRGRLASYKLPARVEFVDTLPRTASLKVRKDELRRRLG
ncbi:class I adenylate-forming enzyme family protein [Klenkia brasiliensis]|uniref:Fatty-acyl-CoA synthase n=1 Tax=Klenkia brasiliensis TaxID=333142 RepID=A0A1G8A3I0_9ACTN|nr:AMP-binding protein [Klenkia brasiliensis]SDH15421.1 fatty-acyl-CoA synthase [Klenkia brasiliensis]